MIVSKILELLGGGDDGDLEVKNTPHIINSQFDYLDVESIATCLNSGANNSLPVVYISCDDTGRYKLSPELLAQRLSGIAHIIVEPSRNFSYQLRRALNDRNVYNGLIGIYWPFSNSVSKISERTIEERRYSPKNAESMTTAQLLTEYIYENIVDALVHQKIRSELTYSTIDNLILRSQINNARKRIETMSLETETTKEQLMNEMRDIQELYEEELTSKNRELDDKERSISYLQNQLIQSQNNITTKSGDNIIALPEGMNILYANEVSDMLVDVLMEKKDGLSNTRRKHVLEQIIRNNQITAKRREVLEKIKNLFLNYNGLDNKTKQELKKIGFEVEDEGKHYKLKHLGCDNFYVTFAKTPSDRRVGENIYRTIKNTFF